MSFWLQLKKANPYAVRLASSLASSAARMLYKKNAAAATASIRLWHRVDFTQTYRYRAYIQLQTKIERQKK